jgi:hypothetical protein
MIKISVMAFDKNTNAFLGQTIVTDSKHDFNEKFEAFQQEVPYSKFYTEIEPLSNLSEEQMEIIEDHLIF